MPLGSNGQTEEQLNKVIMQCFGNELAPKLDLKSFVLDLQERRSKLEWAQ